MFRSEPMDLWWNNNIKKTKFVKEFTSGEDVALDQFLVKYDVLGSIAHAIMLNKIGILSVSELEKVKRELKMIIKLEKEGRFQINTFDEDVHLKVEDYLTRKLDGIGKKIHTGRSRNDQVLVDTRLYAKEKLLNIQEKILDICSVLVEFGEKNKDAPMPGYTHFRKAMPSSVGLWSLSFVESLLDDLILLKSAYDLNNQNPLGSAAGFGVPINIDRELTTKLLGFEKVQNNVLYVQNSRGKIESAILSALSQVMLDLGKFSNDLIIFSSDEFGFFELPEFLCTGSSIMPKKRNPDVLELIRARANKVFSYLSQTISIIKDLPSGYNRDLQETKEPLIKGFNIVDSCLDMVEAVIKNLKINENKLVNAFNSQIFATDEALNMVSKGMPFRDAYKNVELNFLHPPKELQNPKHIIKGRTHTGTTGNLGVENLQKEIVREKGMLLAEKEKFKETVGRLLK